ncbi:MAG: hypothetical protein P8R04_07690 [Gammaproteobacteria bacterium]|nr:hypothetical protein [Gammaproteobacteria bacterium]
MKHRIISFLAATPVGAPATVPNVIPDARIQQKDTYGVHLDQYGRPVQVKPQW